MRATIPLRFARRGAVVTVLAVVCGMSLSACIGPGGYSVFDDQAGYPAFAEEQSAADVLPPDFDELDLAQFDPDTSRYSGSYNDADYFLIRMTEDTGGGHCLAVAAGINSSIVCGGDMATLSYDGGVEAQLMPAPAISADGWTSISDNVRVRE
ncbi:hypothetical protein B0I08_103358 [Glaciihabitans tibetensis]|uniref:Lipoprotein n=1 Tax=Glaciihabitans tibetensis TaxID=1266600 RepID=A0A2T0VG29_9MICO|nr:hypothetical protein [Glaciihabitans tibetensis]PRY69151.1 hypothetical protein B0I08_103358 [Glaciihabitans tibetensis]